MTSNPDEELTSTNTHGSILIAPNLLLTSSDFSLLCQDECNLVGFPEEKEKTKH